MPNDYTTNLRRRAEVLLNQRDTIWNRDTVATMSEILEELQVHQIELKLQYEELQAAYSELEAERSKYSALYHKMPVGYLQLDVNGFIQEANHYGSDLLRTPRKLVVGKRLAEFIAPEDQPRFHFHLHRVFLENTSQTDELRIHHPDNSITYVQMISHPIKGVVPQACQTLIHDIMDSKRHLMAQALQESALLLTSSLNLDNVLKHILQFVMDIVPCDVAFVALWDEDKRSLSLAQAQAQDDTDPTLQGVQIPFSSSLNAVFESGEPFLMAYTGKHGHQWLDIIHEKMGSPPLLSYIVAPLFIREERLGFLWVGSRQVKHFTSHHLQDLRVFARQAALAVNNARQYAQSQQLATMNERQRIARELHDAVKQNLFSASLIADNLVKNTGEFSEESTQYIEYLNDSLQQALAEMRILLDELQPDHILDVPDKQMLRLLSNRLVKSGIKVKMKTTLDTPLPIPIKVVVYRILQEAITNIQAHAQATLVRIKLCCSPTQIDLVIEDNGRGFDISEHFDGHGLRNMRERVEATDGQIDIQSEKSVGTRVAITWGLTPATV